MFDLKEHTEPERLYLKEYKVRSPKEFDEITETLKAHEKILSSQKSTVGKVRAKFGPLARQLEAEIAEISALLREADAKMDFAEGYLDSKLDEIKVNLREGETAHRTLSDNYDALVEMFGNLKAAHAKAEKSGSAGDWDKAELAAKAYDKAVRNSTGSALTKAGARLREFRDLDDDITKVVTAVREALVGIVAGTAGLTAAVRRDGGKLEKSVRDAERTLRGAD